MYFRKIASLFSVLLDSYHAFTIGKLKIARHILSNGYVPVLPLLLWNILVTPWLPPVYDPDLFNGGVPSWLLAGENVSRAIVLLLPVFFINRVHTRQGKWGLGLYMTGSILYYASWLAIIIAPTSCWSTSLTGFSMPAVTPLIWLTGIAYMAHACYFSIPYKKWYYLVPAVVFVGFHISHTVLSYFHIRPI